MKAPAIVFVVFFVLLATVSLAQDKKTVFNSASLARAADGQVSVRLSWSKGAENTAYYQVEKSSDAKVFKPVALVFTAEDEQWTAYTYSDKSNAMLAGAMYYRIAMVNAQKEVVYLPVQKVELSSAATTGVVVLAGTVIAAK